MGFARSGWPLLGLLAGALLLAACGGASDQEAAPELALPSGRALVMVYTDN